MRSGSRPGDDWALGGGMDTQVDKTVDATRTYLELVRDRPLEQVRVDDAKRAVEQEYRSSRVDPRWIVNWVRSWILRGEEGDPRPWEREQIQKRGTDELKAMIAEYVGQPLIISIIGNKERLDMKALGEIARVEEVKPAQLFSWGPFPAVKAAKKPGAGGKNEPAGD
jgi:hypothetical protein